MTPHTSAPSFNPGTPDAAGVVSWVHIGDLHMTRPGLQNDLDLQAIVQEINTVFAPSISFVYLPGDVADDGSRNAYAVVRHSLDALHAPWCAIVGDHDVHEKSFRNFLEAMSPRTHFTFVVGDVRFVAVNAFDIPEPGSFTVTEDQLTWLKRELQTAANLGQQKVVLLHCYPSDLKHNAGALTQVLHNFDVSLVDMGHTHYNEIANDGRTLYTATRSTGQIEEGPVGYSIANPDHGVVSWRFVERNKLPAVTITSPADERLRTRSHSALRGPFVLRAKAWSKSPIIRMTAHVEGQPLTMQPIPDSQMWQATLPELTEGEHSARVEAEDSGGATAYDEIRIVAGEHHEPERAARDQDNAIPAWPERGLLATQLGPNKNGKKW